MSQSIMNTMDIPIELIKYSRHEQIGSSGAPVVLACIDKLGMFTQVGGDFVVGEGITETITIDAYIRTAAHDQCRRRVRTSTQVRVRIEDGVLAYFVLFVHDKVLIGRVLIEADVHNEHVTVVFECIRRYGHTGR
jgi:hypothetical protein